MAADAAVSGEIPAPKPINSSLAENGSGESSPQGESGAMTGAPALPPPSGAAGGAGGSASEIGAAAGAGPRASDSEGGGGGGSAAGGAGGDAGDGDDGDSVDAAVEWQRGSGPAFVEDELEAFRKEWGTNALLDTLLRRRTPYNRVTVKAFFPEDYPDSPLLFELSSATLAAPVVAKLQKVCEKTASESVGGQQLFASLKALREVVDANLLLYAMEEIRGVMKELKSYTTVQIKANEKAGTVKAVCKYGEYTCTVTLTVPPAYPEEPVGIKLARCNFPESIKSGMLYMAESVARKCAAGFDAVTALTPMEPEAIATTTVKSEVPQYALTAEHMRGLKHDVEFLKEAAELRKFDQAKKQGDHRRHAHAAADRKAARRALKKLTQAEAAAEAKREAEILAEIKAERDAHNRIASDVPQRSVGAILLYLVRDFAVKLPREPCQVCGDPVLPTSVARCVRYAESTSHNKKPMKVYCGHWYHYKCLDEHLTTPPFLKSCPTCGRRVYHKNWTSDIKKLERAWANEQAKRRELYDVADFMSMGDEFAVKDPDNS